MFLAKQKKNTRASYYYHELCSLIYFAAISFISLSILSYHATDSSLFYYHSDGIVIANWCGWLGAHVAAIIWYFLGAAALLCIPAGFFCWYLFWHSITWRQEWERIFGLALAITSIATLFCLYVISLRNSVPGGLVGQWCSYYSIRFLGDSIGVLLTWYTLLIAAIILVTRLSLINGIWLIAQGMQQLFATCMVQKSAVYGLHGLRKIIVILQHLAIKFWHLFCSLLNGSIFSNTGLVVPAQRDEVCCTKDLSSDFSASSAVSFDSSFRSNPLTGSGQSTEVSKSQRTTDKTNSIFESQNVKSDETVNLNIEIESHSKISASTNENTAPFALNRELVEGLKGNKVKNSNLESPNNAAVDYKLPDSTLLIPAATDRNDAAKRKELETRAKTLEEKLERFGIYGSVVGIKAGPVVTLFEYEPAIDTKLSKIVALEDDLALALQAISIRILAPIPGRSVVGFEVANNDRKDVLFSTIFSSAEYQQGSLRLPLILGEDTVGGKVVTDLARMPHLLIAGSTGSGKSVALNAMLVSLLGKLSPAQMKLILIDPKRLEFAPYADIPHLLFPIVTQVQQVPSILRWVVKQMEERYELMAQVGVRNITDYHNASHAAVEPMPYIVVIVDELADLMMTVGRDVEDLITRITQMARAAGIHMIVATQRPSVDVITGLIKVNFPSRISFRVTSKVDSRTILDCGGAEKLLGRGDMLFLDSTAASLRRVHGAYITDAEIARIVHHLRSQQPVAYLNIQEELAALSAPSNGEEDALYDQIVEFVQTQEDVSISLLQRKFRIGYNRAARLIDQLAAHGMILPADNGKTRKVVK